MGLGMYTERIGVDTGGGVQGVREMSMTAASLLGWAVMTGSGAVFHTAQVWPGTTVAVVGCDGIGLSAVQGAKLATRGLYEAGVTRGCSTRPLNYCPKAPVTRAQMASFIIRALP